MAAENKGRVRCPGCGNGDVEQFYIDTLEREWNRYSAALATDGSLEADEHLKSLNVVGEEARSFGCCACGAEFDDESELHEPTEAATA